VKRLLERGSERSISSCSLSDAAQTGFCPTPRYLGPHLTHQPAWQRTSSACVSEKWRIGPQHVRAALSFASKPPKSIEVTYRFLRFKILTVTRIKMAVFCDIVPLSLVRTDRRIRVMMMEAVSTSETSTNFYQATRRYITKHTHRLSTIS
jgi:hypothetical protein